jgi:hypothetical protein
MAQEASIASNDLFSVAELPTTRAQHDHHLAAKELAPMMVSGRGNRKGLESQDVCCRRDAADGRLQKINLAARLGEASERPCRLLALG